MSFYCVKFRTINFILINHQGHSNHVEVEIYMNYLLPYNSITLYIDLATDQLIEPWSIKMIRKKSIVSGKSKRVKSESHP